jgi:hypothetical protein
MTAENNLVGHCDIDLDNVCKWIEFADCKSCALLTLKEYALSFFVACTRDAMKTDSYKNMRQSSDLMEESALATQSTHVAHDIRIGYEASALSVTELRSCLKAFDLD